MHKIVNGQVVDITGTPEEAALLAEWDANLPGTGSKWLTDQDAERTKQRTNASTVFADTDAPLDPPSRVDRAIIVLSAKQFNVLRQWDMALKAAVAGAGTLAQLKTAIAALPNLPDLTAAQVKQAVRDEIAGDA